MAKTYLAPGMFWAVDGQRVLFGDSDIRRADASTFQALTKFWARDAKNVYIVGSEMRSADASTFCVLNELYAKDARSVFTIKGRIPEADVSTFEALGDTEHAFNTTNGYARDVQFVYHTTIGDKACVIKNADVASFTPRGHGYGSDKSAMYFERKKMPGANPAEWRHIRGPHSQSGKNGYVLGQRIRGANGKCLESLPILGISEYWSRDDKGYYRWDEPGDPQAYLNEFRQCFIFLGKVSKVSLTWNRIFPLDPMLSDSWLIAEHAWIHVDCKEWIQKPDVDVTEVPQIGEPFKFGQGLHLELLASRTWMDEDRIWIFKPTQDHHYVEKRLWLSGIDVWWEYLSLDQLDGIRKTIAAASS